MKYSKYKALKKLLQYNGIKPLTLEQLNKNNLITKDDMVQLERDNCVNISYATIENEHITEYSITPTGIDYVNSQKTAKIMNFVTAVGSVFSIIAAITGVIAILK